MSDSDADSIDVVMDGDPAVEIKEAPKSPTSKTLIGLPIPKHGANF